jgi:hypothetical protein
MADIGIVGTGISGLTLALHLQLHGVETTIYTDRTPEQHRAGRLPNLVTRFAPTRDRERKLGVDHWDFPGFGIFALHLSVLGDPPLGFRGDLQRPASAVDFRIYLARLLEDYEDRGGRVVIGSIGPEDVARHSPRHDLMVVASGRDTPGQLFPRDPARSPYTEPQRILCGGLYRGIAYTDPLGVIYNIAPGAGEIFQCPFFSFDGPVTGMLFEAVPGGPLEVMGRTRCEEDPKAFHATALRLLEQHAPPLRDRVDAAAFRLTRPADLIQGAITPTVRRAWAPLPDGRYAMAVGDAWIVNDPVTGQGANLGSHSAWVLAEAILDDTVYDEQFCRAAEQRMWTMAESVTNFTNAFLQPPPDHLVGLLVAATQDQEVADALAEGFADPTAMWRAVASPERTAALLAGVRRPALAGPGR